MGAQYLLDRFYVPLVAVNHIVKTTRCLVPKQFVKAAFGARGHLFVAFHARRIAQGFGQRKWPDLIPLDGKMKRGGLYFGPGITYALARAKDREVEVFRAGDTSYTAIYDPNGSVDKILKYFLLLRPPVIKI